MLSDTITTTVMAWNLTPTAPPGGGGIAMNQLLGIVLWIVMGAAILGLLIIAGIGISAYKHNQMQQFIEKFLWWAVGATLAAAAKPVAAIFFPGL